MVHGPLSIGFARQESQEAFGRVQTSISPSGKWVHKAHFFGAQEERASGRESSSVCGPAKQCHCELQKSWCPELTAAS